MGVELILYAATGFFNSGRGLLYLRILLRSEEYYSGFFNHRIVRLEMTSKGAGLFGGPAYHHRVERSDRLPLAPGLETIKLARPKTYSFMLPSGGFTLSGISP